MRPVVRGVSRRTMIGAAMLSASALLVVLARWVYSPWLASVRAPALIAALLVTALLLVAGAAFGRGATPQARLLCAAVVLAGPSALGLEAWRVARHRQAVLAAPAARLALVGRHVVVGYRTPRDVEPLIERGAIGGIFVTARNASGKTVAALAAEIAALQALAKTSGRSPLIVTTDQEGGLVSRLSPPLVRPPLLATVAMASDTPQARRRQAFAEGARVGADLARVGVTLNLAPLADLDFGIRNPADRMSRIGERALGRDPLLVAELAKAYCDGIASAGVGCTLKHFPGLGRVADDTHVQAARLVAPRAALEAEDWQPYRREARSAAAAVMVGHVVAVAIDAERPASLSPGVVTDVLRGALAFDGVVITDDLCMAAISDRRNGIASGAVAAVHAGVDLVLVSYDPAQVYPALAGLLTVEPAMLQASRKRLDAMIQR